MRKSKSGFRKEHLNCGLSLQVCKEKTKTENFLTIL